ncbi:MAG TPA: response regulator transcription factor [Bryobacteraceae bacterium]|nr:response regulator transcription factor [Bryobacteraceae bacterium]
MNAIQDRGGQTRLLVIDDDEKLCQLLRDYLQPLGYAVDIVHRGDEGLKKAFEEQYAAIILDVMLPGLNGFDVLRELRRRSDVPVLMLTALGEEPDRIAGLEVGADDYLPKTFSTRELLARLRAVLRRSIATARKQAEPQPMPVSVGDLWIDPAARTATLGGASLVLTPIEYDILLTLARSAGRVKSREQLLLDVAERDFEAFDRSIDVHVSSLRKKLSDDPRHPRFIETVRGAGYKMRKPGTDDES